MLPGRRIAQYEISGKLGSGGMGVVYAARDTRLNRAVALKFLPPAWSQDVDAKSRFLREARAASALDHPNIYTIFEIGETDDGSLFIASPLYDGETLKKRLEAGQLSPDAARDLLRQLLEGLAAAHEAGIVHRDVKPANIMVTNGGVVKLLDFGLAKLGVEAHLTREGTTLGTAAYMSPEQASGAAVDHRADLWSVGVVLYEMLTGERPFKGDYEQAVIYSVINEEPAPVRTKRSDLPADLDEIVGRLLSKSPEDRFQNARDALMALGEDATLAPQRPPRKLVAAAVGVVVALMIGGLVWLATPDRGQSVRSAAEVAPDARRSAIAIMPFSNLNDDPETDFLKYALADRIIGSLSYVRELLVRPSSSIRSYVDQAYSTRSVGSELSVDYLLNGTYMRQADEMRLTIELVDVSSDEIIWTEPVQLKYENAFQIQDAVSEKVLRRLQVEFSDVERRHMTYDVSKDPLAYDYFLRAISFPETDEGNRRAVEMLERAVGLDPGYAPAWNQLGFRLQRVGQYSLGGEDPVARAEKAFKKAIELNPNLLEALGNLSTLYTDDGRTIEALQLADRMLEINPSSALGHFARGYALRYAGMTDESVQAMNLAIALDSTDARLRSAGITFIVAGRLDEAERAFRIDAGGFYSDGWVGEVKVRKGQLDDGLRRLQRVAEEDPDGLMGLWAKGIVSALQGEYDAGLVAARRWEESSLVDVEAHYYNASLYCLNGDVDSCIRLLQRAVAGGYYNVDNLLNDRFTEAARADPRFDAIVKLARSKNERFRHDYSR